MDDYSITSLTESKNEWVVRLVNILTPLVNEGLLSIFKESEKLCQENGESDKYLMTFQNFLTRVPKWNNDIIKQETKRIVEKSQCQYLDELITCVHVIHLKLLTSIRAGKNQKKIDIDIPELDPFIHRIYICCARKLYSVVFLYEQNLIPLELQKNRKEIESIIKGSILEVIRESIPVEKILRAYMDETTDIVATIKDQPSDNITTEVKETKDKDTTIDKPTTLETLDKDTSDNVIKVDTPLAINDDKKKQLAILPAPAPGPVLDTESPPSSALAITTTPAPAPAAPAVAPAAPARAPAMGATPPVTPISFNDNTQSISFNDTDMAIGVNKIEEKIDAPKTVERLEAISNERHEQAKLEAAAEEEEEKIKIFDDAPIKMDIQDLTPITLNDTPDIGDIQVLA